MSSLRKCLAGAVGGCVVLAGLAGTWAAGDPPALNPFSPNASATGEREDAIPGYVELSDGSIHWGRVYLTRDKRLKVYDEKQERQREIPLNRVAQVETVVIKEWMQKEFRPKETANDEILYSNRQYPVREFKYHLTLSSGTVVTGELSGAVYVIPGDYGKDEAESDAPHKQVEPEHFVLHKRDKGEMGTTLKALKYVKLIKLGEDAFKEGKKKGAYHPAGSEAPPPRPVKKR